MKLTHAFFAVILLAAPIARADAAGPPPSVRPAASIRAPLAPVVAADLAAYDQALSRVQTALENSVEAGAVAAGHDPDMPARVARKELGGIVSVRMPEGSLAKADTRSLVRAITTASHRHNMESRRYALRALSRRVAALREDLAWEKPGAAAGGGARMDDTAALRSVLNGSAYQSTPIAPPTQIERKWDQFVAWIRKLFARAPSGPTPKIDPAFVKVILILLLAALIAALVAIFVPMITRKGYRPKPPSDDEEEQSLVAQRDSDRLLTLAEQKAAAGDYRLAFRIVYLATLIALDSGGVLRFDRSKTNWEYLRALQAADRNDVAEKMRPLTRTFDRVWYGLSPAGRGEYALALAEHRALVAAQNPGHK
jgi:hypothetical protein